MVQLRRQLKETLTLKIEQPNLLTLTILVCKICRCGLARLLAALLHRPSAVHRFARMLVSLQFPWFAPGSPIRATSSTLDQCIASSWSMRTISGRGAKGVAQRTRTGGTTETRGCGQVGALNAS